MKELKVSKKICLVGDFGTGKTSLVRRFVDGAFSDEYLTTVGVKISRKLVEIDPKSAPKSETSSSEPSSSAPSSSAPSSVQLLIWDLEGSSKFKGISATHLQGASGVIIVADLTRPETIKHLESHVANFLTVNPKSSIIIALNKADLSPFAEIEQIQKTMEFSNLEKILGVYPTSAKTGISVNEIFTKLAHRITLV